MIMRAILIARMMKFARGVLFIVLDDAERARHAQMHQEHVARGQIGQQVFGAAAETRHGLARKPPDKILLEGKPQVFAPDFGLYNSRSLHDRLQAAADGLDFGLFWHGWGLHLELLTAF